MHEYDGKKYSPKIILEYILELPCVDAPPPALEGEGTERNYGPDVTTYRCPNGYMWSTGHWPYLELECLNRKWAPPSLPDCISKTYLSIVRSKKHFIMQRESVDYRDLCTRWAWISLGPSAIETWGTRSSTPAPTTT